MKSQSNSIHAKTQEKINVTSNKGMGKKVDPVTLVMSKKNKLENLIQKKKVSHIPIPPVKVRAGKVKRRKMIMRIIHLHFLKAGRFLGLKSNFFTI